MPQFTDYNTPLPCGCSMSSGRCYRHGLMMNRIHDRWFSGTNRDGDLIWSLQDGYGEPGYTPEQGCDWSGIRDSSTEAIEAMYEALGYEEVA